MRISILFVMLSAVPGWAQVADDSPFIPANSPATAMGQGADGSSFELRGIMSTAGGTRYCIYDPVKKTSAWVGMNEAGGSFLVKSADPVRDTVTLQVSGQVMTLALHESKVVSLGFGSPVASPPPSGAMGPVVLRPTPEDEQRRLQAITEEVRRRRELRQRAQGR
jgi:hypothetical protein